MKTTLVKEEFLAVLQAAEAGLSRNEKLEQSTCFTGDTVIHTLGGDFTVRQLLDMGKTEFKVFSMKGEKLKIGNAHSLRKTKSMAKVYLVKFDTGDRIKLTADHLVMLRTGEYKRVDELKTGDSVMPFNYYYRLDGYRMVYRKVSKKPVRAYRWVFEQTYGYTPKRPNHIHHKDHDPTNDDPTNLQEVTGAEHLSLHVAGDNHPMKRPEVAAKVSAAMLGNQRGVGPKPGTSAAMKGNRHSAKLTWGRVRAIRRKFRKGVTRKELAERYSITESNVCYILKNKTWVEPGNNHKVESVTFCGREDVYDLSVDKYHNFAASGVFIHNCFVFRKGRVHTFNEEVAVRAKSGLPDDFTGAVQSGTLLAFLKKTPAHKLTVRPAGGTLLLTAGGDEGSKFRYAEKIQLPVESVETPKKEDWRKLPPNFAEAVSVVQECVGKDESKTAMSCVNLTPAHVEAFEKFQATRYTVKLPFDDSFLVKPKGLKHVCSLDCTRVAVGTEWVHFRNDAGVTISCRRYDEQFPDLDPALDMAGGLSFELPDGLDAVISRAEDFSRENADENHLLVVLEDGLMKVEAIGMTAQYWKDMSVKYRGDPLAFLIAPKMLAEVVKRSNRVKINKEKLRVKGPGWQYVTSLTDPDTARQAAEEAAGAAADDLDGEDS